MAVQGSSSDTNAAHIGTIVVNHSKLYSKNATLVEIFGPQVQPGRELLDEITRIYKAVAQGCVDCRLGEAFSSLSPSYR